jgi:hypothetical protein
MNDDWVGIHHAGPKTCTVFLQGLSDVTSKAFYGTCPFVFESNAFDSIELAQ